MSNPRTYRYPGYIRFLMAFGTIFFMFLAFFVANDFSITDKAIGASYPFVGFALFSLIPFVWTLYTIRITDDEIIVTNFLRAKRLRWNEVSKVEHKGDGFRLKNHDEDVVLKIDAQVVKFIEILDYIKQRIPQVWDAEDVTEFHPSGNALSGIILFGFVGIYMMFAAMYGDTNGDENLSVRVLLFIFGLLCIGFLFFVTTRISVENEYLVVFHIGWKQRIHASEVEKIFMIQTRLENASSYQTHVKLKNKKTLRFTSLREGTFQLATSLEKWLQRYNNPTGKQ